MGNAVRRQRPNGSAKTCRPRPCLTLQLRHFTLHLGALYVSRPHWVHRWVGFGGPDGNCRRQESKQRL